MEAIQQHLRGLLAGEKQLFSFSALPKEPEQRDKPKGVSFGETPEEGRRQDKKDEVKPVPKAAVPDQNASAAPLKSAMKHDKPADTVPSVQATDGKLEVPPPAKVDVKPSATTPTPAAAATPSPPVVHLAPQPAVQSSPVTPPAVVHLAPTGTTASPPAEKKPEVNPPT